MEVKPYNLAIVAVLCQSTFAAMAAFGLAHTDPLSFSLMTQTIILFYGVSIVAALCKTEAVSHMYNAYSKLFGDPKTAFLSVLSASAILGSDILLYIALTMSPKIDAYVIQTIWPVLAIAIGALFVRGKWGKMPRGATFLVLVSCLSAAAIVSQGLITFDYRYVYGYLAAFGCALCGGIFTVVNPLLFDRLEGRSSYLSSVTVHFVLRSLTVPVFAILLLRFADLHWATEALPFSMWVGVVVWGVGGSLWTIAYSSAKNLSITSLPYFAVIGNVFFLYIFHAERITLLTLIAGAIILLANLLLHAKYRRFQTDKISILCAILLSVAIVYLPEHFYRDLSFEPIFVGALFGVISAFTLNRLVARNRRSEELLAEISADASSVLRDTQSHESSRYIRDNFDTILRCLLDYEFSGSKEERNDIMRQILACETNIRRCVEPEKSSPLVREHFERFARNLSRWATTRKTSVTMAEVVALNILAIVAIAALITSQAGTLVGDIFSIITSIAIIFLLAAIRYQNRTQMPRKFSGIVAQQHLLNRCGFESYLPKSYTESDRLPSPTSNHKFRCTHGSSELTLVRKQPFIIRQFPWVVVVFIFALISLAVLQKYGAL